MSYESIRHEQKMALAYVAITAKYGPSQQLIDFINYDNSLFSDLGLESLNAESMSVETQHELILSRLDTDALEGLALEDLSGLLVKAGNFALQGAIGFIRGQVGKAIVMGGFSLLTMAAKNLKAKKDAAQHQVVSPSTLHELFKLADDLNHLIHDVAKSAPSTLDHDAWNKYKESAFDLHMKKYEAIYMDFEKSRKVLVNFDDANWTSESFIQVTKTFEDSAKKSVTVLEEYTHKLESLAKLVKAADKDKMNTADIIHSTIGKTKSLVELNKKMCGDLATDIKKIAACFEHVE